MAPGREEYATDFFAINIRNQFERDVSEVDSITVYVCRYIINNHGALDFKEVIDIIAAC